MNKRTDHKMKGLTVAALGSMALTILVAAIIISMGATILTDLGETQCPYTMSTPGQFNSSSEGVNPLTSSYDGCCQTIGTVDSGNCSVWYTSSAALNATYKGTTGLITFANWIPMIALVVVAAIVIGVIVTYLGKAGGGA